MSAKPRRCLHRSHGGPCYECATGRPRQLIPGQIQPTPDASDRELRTYRLERGELAQSDPPAVNRGWSRLMDKILTGDVD